MKTYFLSPEQLDEAIERYGKLVLNTKEEEIAQGERFFEEFGPGNLLEITDRPFERFTDYEVLLREMLKKDTNKYRQIDKGTPFHFLGWTAFDLRNYEKALFYLDAAISEDIRNAPDWLSNPGARFLTLKEPEDQVSKRVVMQIRVALDAEITRFNAVSGLPSLTLEALINGLFSLIGDIKNRTVITAFYTFVLEFQDRYGDLQLRSVEGGSVEPFLTHMFKGALIFESLLKVLYPVDPRATLSDVFKAPSFRWDFALTDIRTSANSLLDVLSAATGEDMKTAFTVTAMIRNTTGHNLVRDDIFADEKNYRLLFSLEMDALLYLIRRKLATQPGP